MDKSLQEVARVLGGRIQAPAGDIRVTGVATDSRKVKPGDLFVALRGENHDGHEFASQALAAGAAGVLVSRHVEQGPSIQVPDTLFALQELAAHHRDQFDIPVIAVTGSVGKTTTKDLLAACLEGSLSTLKTPGNYNNEIGLPLTLLGLEPGHQACVIELAMRGPGEIAALARIAKPTGCIIVNVAPVHLETLGSLENIARAKCEVLPFTRDFAVVNGDLPELQEVPFNLGRIYRFGFSPDCDWRVRRAYFSEGETIFEIGIGERELRISLPLPAVHLAENVTAAVGTALLLGIDYSDIRHRLMRFAPSAGRLTIKSAANGAAIIDDTYNANPASMKAALQVLSDYSPGGRKIAILGDMFELGPYEIEGHRSVGRAAADLGIDMLLTVGERGVYIMQGAEESGFKGTRAHFATKQDLMSCLRDEILPQDVILVKGSRGMRMEEIVKALLDASAG